MTLATSSPISTPNLLWPFPFCQMDWAVTPPAVQDYIETLQGRVNQLQKDQRAHSNKNLRFHPVRKLSMSPRT